MFSNNNKEIIKKLAKSSLKNNKLRNNIAGSIIILATALLVFTAVFGFNVYAALKQETKFDVTIQNATNEQIAAIQNDANITKVGKLQRVGNGKINTKDFKFMYLDEVAMEQYDYTIVKGAMPQINSEILVEKDTIKNAKIGDEISLTYRNEISREIDQNNFTISGFFTSPQHSKNQQVFLLIAPYTMIQQDSHLANYQPDILLNTVKTTDAKELITTITASLQIAEKDIFFSTVKDTSIEMLIMILGLSLIILLACFIVIYNVFYISIIQKTKEFGQLRTIGTTKKQVKKIVYTEGINLAKMFIPLGAIVGILASYLAGPTKWLMIPDMIIISVTLIIIFLTICYSMKKPAKIAANNSPIESAKIVESVTKKNRNSHKKMTPSTLGMMNITRNKKKTLLTMISLVFTGVLLITTATIVSSFTAEAMAARAYHKETSAIVELNSELLSPTVSYTDLQKENPLNEALATDIREISGVSDVVIQKTLFAQIIDSRVVDDDGIEINSISAINHQQIVDNWQNGKIEELDNAATNIIINTKSGIYRFLGITIGTGDTLNIKYIVDGQEVQKTLTVIGETAFESSMLFFAADKSFAELTTENVNTQYHLIVPAKQRAAVDEAIIKKTNDNDRLAVRLLSDEIESYQKMLKTTTMTIYGFTIFIAIFAMVNLFNTIITNVISRKHETGVLQTIGLTNKQLIQSLYVENSFFIFGSFIISIVIGNLLGFILATMISNQPGLSYVSYKFPLTSLIYYFIAMLFIMLLVTTFIKKDIKKHSVIDRLKNS